MNAEVFHHLPCVGEDVHEVRDRRALIAGDIRDAGLQQRLGDGENALSAKDLAGAEAQVLNFALKGPFRHRSAPWMSCNFICTSIFSGPCPVNETTCPQKSRA